MSHEPVGLDKLHVVGYAEILNEDLLPAIVYPVYMLDDRAILPPYAESNGHLQRFELSKLQFDPLVTRKRITGLSKTFAGKPDHLLWIDSEFRPHYEEATVARSRLNAIATGALTELFGEIESQPTDVEPRMHVRKLLRTALAANEKHPLVSLAFALVHQGRDAFIQKLFPGLRPRVTTEAKPQPVVRGPEVEKVRHIRTRKKTSALFDTPEYGGSSDPFGKVIRERA